MGPSGRAHFALSSTPLPSNTPPKLRTALQSRPIDIPRGAAQHLRMARVSVLLALLLVVLTFNAYACILPLPQPPAMGCPSETEEPARGTCDAFLELGPQSQASFSDSAPTFQLQCALPVHLLLDSFVPLVQVTEPPHSADSPIHLSIPTTVLRI